MSAINENILCSVGPLLVHDPRARRLGADRRCAVQAAGPVGLHKAGFVERVIGLLRFCKEKHKFKNGSSAFSEYCYRVCQRRLAAHLLVNFHPFARPYRSDLSKEMGRLMKRLEMFSMKDTNGNICFPKVILLIKGSYLYINTYRVIIDNVELVESVCKNDTSK